MSTTMIVYNIRLTLRRMRQELGFLSIALLGLVTGISAFLVLFLYVHNETTFDKNIPDYKNIYRVQNTIEGGENSPWARSFGIIKPASQTFPELEELTQFAHSPEGTVKIGEKSFQFNDILSVDEGFFGVFSVKMKMGDYTEISKPNVVFISEEVAKKYFKGENPIGKTIEISNLEYDQKLGSYEIRGVVENMQQKTHFRYDILLSQKGTLQGCFEMLSESAVYFAYHYVKLRDNTSTKVLSDKYKNYFNASSLANMPGIPKYKFNLVPITDIHLKSNCKRELKPNSNNINIGLLRLISAIVLIFSLLNFINLSFAKIIKRSKEFGLRKFIGANNRQLILQIIVEVAFKTIFAISISLFLIELIKSGINHFFDIDFDVYYSEPIVYLVILGIELLTIGLTALFVGFYFFRSSSAINILSSKVNYSGSLILRTLLVIQVAIVIFLLSTILIVNKQVDYILNQPLGFDKENVLVIKLKGFLNDTDVFANELREQSEVVSVGIASQHLGLPSNLTNLEDFGLNGDLEYVMCDYNYLSTMNIKMTENWCDEPMKAINGLVVNNHFYKRLIEKYGGIEGFKNFQQKKEFIPNMSQMRIIGVTNDFNYSSAHVPVGDFAFWLLGNNSKSAAPLLHIRLAKGDLRKTMGKVEEIWKKHYQEQPFKYFFLEDKITEQYKAEILLRKILMVFTLICFVISTIGITVFSLFISQQRTKEIGIRKVNGAKISEVLVMLNRDFIKWVAIAFVVATPIAYYAMNKWLENFAYKTELSWWIFVVSGLLALGIALLTVSWQSWRAATRNPVESLRYE